MSSKSILLHAFLIISAQLRGSHATRTARDRFCQFFVRLILDAGYVHVRSIADIRMRHVQLVLDQAKKVSPGTASNWLAHLRGILRAGGNWRVIQQIQVSNHELGIGPRSRIGTKRAMNDEEFSALLARIDDPYLKALLLLQHAIGLRAMESMRAGPCLERWLSRLLGGFDSVEVVFGCKGGRTRSTHIHDRAQAIEAIRVAIKVLDRNGHLAPATSLKAAAAWYRNSMYTLGAQGHRLRYAFACAAVDYYLSQGICEKEAYARVALDLGHGDGRGRWVKMVYCREKLVKN